MKRIACTAAAAVAIGAASLSPTPSDAKVIEFKVLNVESPAFEGRSFGAIGTYEKVTARAKLAVDPNDRRNIGIADITAAPRNARGLVEYETDVVILKPTDIARSNGRLFYEVNNRGNKLSLGWLNDAVTGNAIKTAADAGNGFLMNNGFIVVWSGWQADVGPGNDRVVINVPTVAGVTGTSREEYVFENTNSPIVGLLTYPAADLNPALAKLTVRNREADPRATPADLKWTYKDARNIEIVRPAGFGPGAIYEFIYPARDPIVMGLGLAATRDVISFLRRDTRDSVGNPNPLSRNGQPGVQHAIGFGISQSGRYVRNFLYEGFNEDEAGRAVFDGLMPHIGGSRRTFTNFRFAQPGRFQRQHEDHNFPGDQFPFTYAVTTDRLTGRTDGLFAKCLTTNTCPKVIQTDSAAEVWQARASLVVTDTDGRHIDLPPSVRAYQVSSTQHGSAFGAKPTANAVCEQLSNPIHVGAPLRALVVAMDRWLIDGTEPPASRFPTVKDGTLVPAEQLTKDYLAVPGLSFSAAYNTLRVKDIATNPPGEGAAYPVFVGRVDADGNDVAGIRLPEIDAPLATYLGWNPRKAGSEGDLCSVTGSFIPFAKTRAERQAANDPRLSLEERYPTHAVYVDAVAKSANKLVQDRLMLADDAAWYIDTARAADIGRPRN